MSDLIILLCGGLVGLTIGAIGGGGSVMATPLLVYVVGLSPHAAIGTGALAVSVSAFVQCGFHARAGHVRWPPALLFAVCGMGGAMAGSTLGKAFDGQRLIVGFAMMMVVIATFMLKPKNQGSSTDGALTYHMAIRIAGVALIAGLLAGFFGIGGGVLIVPGLVVATGMPMIFAIGTSLVAVGCFGLVTALNYAASGLIETTVATELIVGGVVGGWLGMKAATRLARYHDALNRLFAGVLVVVAGYILWRAKVL